MKKQIIACGLAASLLLPSLSPALAAPEDAPRQGTPTAEANTGDMNRIPYNNADAVVDLDAGTWAQPAVMDLDGDGHLDLLVSGTAVCYGGTYVFYGGPGSRETLVMEKGLRLDGGRGNFYPTYLYSQAEKDGEPVYTYEDTLLFTGSTAYPDFKTSLYRSGQSHGGGVSWPKAATRADEYSLVDYDGDGVLDLIRGVGSWDEYGWAGKFDPDGHWGGESGDPLHGWVMWCRNTGTDEAPVYEPNARLVCVGDDPKTPIDVYGHPAPSFFDWDGDGDLDLMCGSFVDDILYFQNTGTRTRPVYAPGVPPKLEDGRNLQMELCMLTTTSFDWNGDGLMDLIVGEEDGRVSFIENTGRSAANGAPVFKAPAYFQTPADNLKVGILCTPFSLDWDGDGDEDLFCGDSAGFFSFIENITPQGGDLTDPAWAPRVRLTGPDGRPIRILAGPNGSIQGPAEEKWGYTVLSMADWDGDGKVDIMANSIWGKIVWMRNIGQTGQECPPRFAAPEMVEVDYGGGKPAKPAWNWWDPEPNELVSQWRTTPFMIDLNGDGLMDLVMQDHQGFLAFYERYEENGVRGLRPGERVFLGQNGAPLQLNGGSLGGSGRTKLLLVDWDQDGKLDIVRNDGTSVAWLRNIGDGEEPYKFAGQVSLHGRKIAAHTTSPTVVDWNKDGVPDLVVGAEDGHFYYMENKTKAPEPPRTDLDDYLVAHWDFTGETQADQLRDKAPKGQSADDLSIEGSVTIADGVATIDGGAGSVLNAGNLADVNQPGPMTIFLKVKVGAGEPADFIGLADKRMFTTTDRAYALLSAPKTRTMSAFVSGTGSANDTVPDLGSSTPMPADAWREMALVADRAPEGGPLTVSAYLSAGEETAAGSDFAVLFSGSASSVTGIVTTSKANLLLGRDHNRRAVDVPVSYRDVRIYDTALTPDELASLFQAEPAPETATLRSLTVAGADPLPAFDPGVRQYAAVVGEDVAQVTVSAAARNGSVTVNGAPLAPEGTAVPLETGENTISVRAVTDGREDLFTEYVLSIQRQAPSDQDPADHLVAKWDFIGETEAEQLSDKATAGGEPNDLVKGGAVRIENGLAVFDAQKSSVLSTPGTADLQLTGELTLVAKVRMEAKQSVLGIVDRRHFKDPNIRSYGMYTSDGGASGGTYAVGAQFQGRDVSPAQVRSAQREAARLGEWATLVTIAQRAAGGDLAMYLYASTVEEPRSSADFTLLNTPVTAKGFSEIAGGDQTLYIGNNTDMQTMTGRMEIAEVRIYDSALTLTQLAQLEMPLLPPPAKTAAELQALMDLAPSRQGVYSESTWQALLAALDAARTALTQGEQAITDAYWALDEAIQSLRTAPVTIAQLSELLDTAPEDQGGYPDEPWEALKDAAARARDVVEDDISPLPSPKEIAAAYLELRTALEALTAKETQAAPGDLGKTDETIEGAGDGTITGVTGDMEYQGPGQDGWTKAAGPAITGLAPGGYLVRYSGTDTLWPSPAVTVTISAGSPAVQTHTVTFLAEGRVVASIPVVEGGTLTADEFPAVPEKTGHTGAWDADGDLTDIRGDQTVTAVYVAETYSVTLDPGENAQVDPQQVEVTYGQPYGQLPEPATDTDRLFDGWSTEAEGGSTVTPDTPVTTAGDHTLFARWREPGTTALPDDTIAGMPDKVVLPFGESIGLSVKEGYLSYRWQTDTGAGWSDLDGETGPAYTIPAADITIGSDGWRYQCIVTAQEDGKAEAVSTGSPVTLHVEKGVQAAPEGLTGQAPTSQAGDDGKVLGLDGDKNYEYRAAAGEADYTAPDRSTEISGLSAGTWLVRLAETDDYAASPDAAVVVPGYVPEEPPVLDTKPIDDAVAAAGLAKAGVVVSGEDPGSVAKGTRFVTQAVMDALDGAIAAAEAARDTAGTQAELQAVADALLDAAETFRAAVQVGTYVRPSGGGSSSSTTTKTEKNEDGSTTKTVTNKSTGKITRTTTWPSGDKTVTVTARDGTVTETATKKDGSRSETVTETDGSVTAEVRTAQGLKLRSETAPDGRYAARVSLPERPDGAVPLPVAPVRAGMSTLTVETGAPATVVVPVEDLGVTTVAVLVKEDGSEEILKRALPAEGGLAIPVTGGMTVRIADNAKGFGDMEDHWAGEAVAFVTSRDLFNGTGGGGFEPDAPMSRAMLVTVLARLDGQTAAGGETWYARAMDWGSRHGITDGAAPEADITRESLAVMLWRYAGRPAAGRGGRTLTDSDGVSGWAVEAMDWALDTGILSGDGGGALRPQSPASRAEVATILTRYLTAMAQ